MMNYLGGLCPDFVKIRNPSVLARFRKRHIHLLDSSTIQLVLNSIDWARHRAKKAAAKSKPTLGFYYTYKLSDVATGSHHYVGCTQDLHLCLSKHNKGDVPHTLLLS